MCSHLSNVQFISVNVCAVARGAGRDLKPCGERELGEIKTVSLKSHASYLG